MTISDERRKDVSHNLSHQKSFMEWGSTTHVEFKSYRVPPISDKTHSSLPPLQSLVKGLCFVAVNQDKYTNINAFHFVVFLFCIRCAPK